MSFEYFTLAELRALPGMADTATYMDARCSAAHDWIVGIVERVVGTSFIGRKITDERYDGGLSSIVLYEPYVLSVESASENGVNVIDPMVIRGGNVLVKVPNTSNYALPWYAGTDGVVISYTAGYSATPPLDIKEACLKAARYHLLETDSDAAVDERKVQVTSDQGTVTMSPVDEDHPTGYPSVDAVIIGWRDRLDVGGFA